MKRLVVLVALAVLSVHASAQQSSIVNSLHNLSVSGPGSIRASSEQEVCIFCHAPHNTSPVQPLWNRNQPIASYTVYSSSSLKAKPGQPTGSSKLCLSCHDGTIAVGSVVSRDQPIAMAGGITTLPPGHGNLGTDLSDDHPISFRYDAGLVGQDPKIKSPSQLPTAVKLDANQEMQCTSCHDAHNNTYGKFLVMDNTGSQLCTACHIPGTTNIASHSTCQSCHQMHSAPSGALLLTGVDSSEACLTCHSSNMTGQNGANIGADLVKLSKHHRATPRSPMTPDGTDTSLQGSVVCSDCHEAHSMQTGTASAPNISPKLGRVGGVNTSGGKILPAQYEYEVCFKCHADTSRLSPTISRQIVQTNTRLQFSGAAVSYHPVEVAGKSNDVPSLRAGYTTGSLIYCTDCHQSDTSKAAGSSGPNGPHGSNVSPLLIARYDTTDNTAESASAYALCYRCHDRASILADQSYAGHALHIVGQQTPCSVCHDAHGISSTQGNSTNNAHLINFDTTIVRPDPATGKIEYRSLGPRMGQCTLSCHGVDHSAKAYPAAEQLLPPGAGEIVPLNDMQPLQSIRRRRPR